jgi:hypothetical protein
MSLLARGVANADKRRVESNLGIDCSWRALVLTTTCLRKMVRDPAARLVNDSWLGSSSPPGSGPTPSGHILR